MQRINNYTVHLEQIKFLGYMVLQLFCDYCLWCMMGLNILYVYINTSQSTCTVSNMAVFCSSLISRLPSMLLRYCLYDFETVPVAPVIAGITLVLTYHMPVFPL